MKRFVLLLKGQINVKWNKCSFISWKLPSLEILPFSNSLLEIHSDGISSESSLISSAMLKFGFGKIFPNPILDASTSEAGKSKS